MEFSIEIMFQTNLLNITSLQNNEAIDIHQIHIFCKCMLRIYFTEIEKMIKGYMNTCLRL